MNEGFPPPTNKEEEEAAGLREAMAADALAEQAEPTANDEKPVLSQRLLDAMKRNQDRHQQLADVRASLGIPAQPEAYDYGEIGTLDDFMKGFDNLTEFEKGVLAEATDYTEDVKQASQQLNSAQMSRLARALQDFDAEKYALKYPNEDPTEMLVATLAGIMTTPKKIPE